MAVTLGRITTAGSPACPAAPSDVVAKAGSGRRGDDARLARAPWSASWSGAALRPHGIGEADEIDSAGKAALEFDDWRRWEESEIQSQDVIVVTPSTEIEVSPDLDMAKDERLERKFRRA